MSPSQTAWRLSLLWDEPSGHAYRLQSIGDCCATQHFRRQSELVSQATSFELLRLALPTGQFTVMHVRVDWVTDDQRLDDSSTEEAEDAVDSSSKSVSRSQQTESHSFSLHGVDPFTPGLKGHRTDCF